MLETFFAFLIWASAGAFIARSGAEPIQAALWRYAVAGICLLAAGLYMRGRGDKEPLVPWTNPLIWVSGFLMLVGNIFFNHSVTHGPVAIAGLIYGNIPVVVPLISYFCGLEKKKPLGLINGAGFFIAFFGNYLLFKGLFHADIEIGESVVSALVAAICFGLVPVFAAALQTKGLRDWALLRGQTSALLVLVPPIAFFLYAFGLLPIENASLVEQSAVIGAASALVLTILPFFLWYRGIRKVGPARTTLFIFLNPLLACLYSMFVAHDLPLNWLTGPGAVFVVIGMLMNVRES